MSQFPVEDEAGLYEAINYLLSGPAGLGQNFEGFSTYFPAYIRPANRAPFTIPLTTTQNPNWYVAPIAISNIVALDTNSFQVTYASTQTPAPFTAGDVVSISGVDDSGGETFNGDYTILSGDSSGIVCGTQGAYTWATYNSGGEVSRDWTDVRTSTDCNAFVTVYGPTDQVFISAQLQLDYDWTASTANSEFDLLVQINRYRGFPIQGQPGQFVFQFDTTITQQRYHQVVSTANNDSIESIFSTALDSPGYGFYYYILEVQFVTRPKYNNSQVPGPAVLGNLRNNRYTYSGTISSGQYTPGSYTGVTASGGTGTGADFDIDLEEITGATVYSSLNVTARANAGSGYAVGDVLTILGADIGGTTPANNLTMTVTSVLYPGDALPGQLEAKLRSLTAQVIKQ